MAIPRRLKSLATPSIATALRDDPSLVAVNVTGDLCIHQLETCRQATSPFNIHVGRRDSTRLADLVSWYWLTDIHSHDCVVAAVEAVIGSKSPNNPQPYVAQRDRQVIPRLNVAVIATATLRVTTLVAGANNLAMLSNIAALSGKSGDRFAGVNSLTTNEIRRTLCSVVNALDIVENSRFAQVTRNEQFALCSLTEMPRFLLLGAPLSSTRTSISVLSLIIALLIRELYTRFGSANAHRLSYFIDKAPRLTGRVDLEVLFSAARGAGLSVLLVAQDVAQFGNENERATICFYCAAYSFLPTLSGRSVSYSFSRFGDSQVSTLSVSHEISNFTPASSTRYSRGKRLFRCRVSGSQWILLGHHQVLSSMQRSNALPLFWSTSQEWNSSQ